MVDASKVQTTPKEKKGKTLQSKPFTHHRSVVKVESHPTTSTSAVVKSPLNKIETLKIAKKQLAICDKPSNSISLRRSRSQRT